MIKLKSLLQEVASESVEFTESQLFDFFKKNEKKFEKLFDEDEWDDFYEMAFDKFPDADQDDVAQALNKAAMRAGWLSSEAAEMPTEKDLEKLSFGDSPGKGIKMDDYDKKQKSPKASPTDLYAEGRLQEAEYRGRKVKLGKPFYTPGGPRKRAVYVRNDKGNVVKVGFGEPGMKIKKNNPARRKSFRARHNCDNPGPRWKARYWSCKAW